MRNIECNCCINTAHNPSITISDDGLCNVCRDYQQHFNRKLLDDELLTIKNFISSENYDCMVGLSGGKDSTAMLSSLLDLGFHPQAFSFQIHYNNLTDDVIKKIKNITQKLHVDYKIIDISDYITETERACFRGMADVYDKALSKKISEAEFRELYFEGRKFYSTKQNIVFPFVRPCQICRKIVVRAYYAEAVKRNIKIVFVGINEWASKNFGRYSALRRLKPKFDSQEVFIVHLPYLLQKKYSNVLKTLEDISCKEHVVDTEVKTGGNSCALAKACESIAFELLGFHLDAPRLSREVTVGFIDKEIARRAIESSRGNSYKTVREVLTECHII